MAKKEIRGSHKGAKSINILTGVLAGRSSSSQHLPLSLQGAGDYGGEVDMATFVISDLDTQEFTFENIRFKKLTGNTPLEKRWREKFRATFIAEADDDLDVKPIIKEGSLVQVVFDICLLLSLARSRSINCPYYNIGGRNGMDYQRFSSPRGRLSGNKLIHDNNLESYLSTAVQNLRKPRYAEKTGFIPSVYYLLERYRHEPSDVGFMLVWIALEVLANNYASRHKISSILSRNKFKMVKQSIVNTLSQIEITELPKEPRDLITQKVSAELNRLSIRSKICNLRDAYGWDFITDKLLSDCIKVRNHIMHLGTYGNFNREIMPHLYFRIGTSVQLALIYILGCSDYVHNLQEILRSTHLDQ